MKRFSDEHCMMAVRLLALRLRRPPMSIDWRAHGCRPGASIVFGRWRGWDRFLVAAGVPAPPANNGYQRSNGHRKYWTTERVIAGMRAVKEELGHFPRNNHGYYPLKKGRDDWPCAVYIFALGGPGRGSWRRALIRAGLQDQVKDMEGMPWRQDEDEFLQENAGSLTLKAIGRRLGRSVGACRRRLYDFGVRARDCRGFYTASVLAQELNVPLTRVTKAVRLGLLVAEKRGRRPYYQIDPASVEAARDWLLRPKQSWKRRASRTRWTRRTGRQVAA